MSQAVHAGSSQATRAPPQKFMGAMADTAAAAEIAVRVAVGSISVQAIAAAVREHPILSLVLASGIGYLVGNSRRSRGERPAMKNGR
jgi:hypothetical protein